MRAFVRNSEHAGALMALGATEVSFGGFEDPRALARAAAGAQAIYHICPNVSRDEVAYARAVAAAARAHGVNRFVYHSVLHPQIEAMPHHWQKMRAEEMLLASGFDLTVLQPTAYMQNILGAWRGVVADGVFRVPYPVETRLSLVDLDDVAEAAAIVLTQEGHSGATYELVGTNPLDQSEVAAAIGAALGRKVCTRSGDARRMGGARSRRRHGRARTHNACRRCSAITPTMALSGTRNTLRWLLGRAPNDLAAFSWPRRRAVARLIWAANLSCCDAA